VPSPVKGISLRIQ